MLAIFNRISIKIVKFFFCSQQRRFYEINHVVVYEKVEDSFDKSDDMFDLIIFTTYIPSCCFELECQLK